MGNEVRGDLSGVIESAWMVNDSACRWIREDEARAAISGHWASGVTLTKNRGCREETGFTGRDSQLINSVYWVSLSTEPLGLRLQVLFLVCESWRFFFFFFVSSINLVANIWMDLVLDSYWMICSNSTDYELSEYPGSTTICPMSFFFHHNSVTIILGFL